MNGMRKYLIFSGLIVLGYLAVQYFKPKATDWKTSYLSEDKIPFGTYILKQRIQDIFPKTEVRTVDGAVFNTLKEKPEGRSNYFIIASTIKVDQLDFREMIKYMKSGNNIFIAADNIEGILSDSLKLTIKSDFNFNYKKKYPINFTNPTIHREFDYYFDKGSSNQYFSEVDSSKTIVLGKKQNKEVNFIQYKFNKGSLFILPNPQLLTNYSLLNENGMDYAQKALSYLPKAGTLIWDEHFLKQNTNGSELRVIFNNDRLKWAYYIALFGLLIFVIFEVKRRQRIIPVIDRLKNTAVEFVSVVGRVYYQQRNNRDIAEKKVSYLLEYIRSNYRLKTVELDQEFKESLIHGTGVNQEIIEELLIEIAYLHAGGKVSDQQLIRLNKLIEQFYKQDQ